MTDAFDFHKQRMARIRANELLCAARTMAELAGELLEENGVHDMDFDCSRSSGVTNISWYNSSESC